MRPIHNPAVSVYLSVCFYLCLLHKYMHSYHTHTHTHTQVYKCKTFHLRLWNYSLLGISANVMLIWDYNLDFSFQISYSLPKCGHLYP